MLFTRQSWHKLRLNLAFLALNLAIFTLLLSWINHYRLEQKLALNIQIRSLAEAKLGIQKIKNELVLLNEYEPHYALLLAQAQHHEGLLNPSNRATWAMQLQAQQKFLQLFPISYSINLNAPLKHPIVSEVTDLPIELSRIAFEFDLLHEEDLVQLTEALATSKSQVFIWRDCEITRLQQGPWHSDQLKANLHAKCRLDSISLHMLLPRQAYLP